MEPRQPELKSSLVNLGSGPAELIQALVELAQTKMELNRPRSNRVDSGPGRAESA